MIGEFDKNLVIGPYPHPHHMSITYFANLFFCAIFISIETRPIENALRPRSPLDSSERLLMTKTYGYEGVFIDSENDRGSQGMILKMVVIKS